jgi:hypothetical protein
MRFSRSLGLARSRAQFLTGAENLRRPKGRSDGGPFVVRPCSALSALHCDGGPKCGGVAETSEEGSEQIGQVDLL